MNAAHDSMKTAASSTCSCSPVIRAMVKSISGPVIDSSNHRQYEKPRSSWRHSTRTNESNGPAATMNRCERAEMK